MTDNSNDALRAALEPFAAGPCTCGEVYRAAGVAVCATCKARAALAPSPVAGGDLRTVSEDIWRSLKRAFLKDAGPEYDEIGKGIAEPHLRAFAASLNQPAAPVEAASHNLSGVWAKPEYAAADEAYQNALRNDANDQMTALALAVDAAFAAASTAARPEISDKAVDAVYEAAMADAFGSGKDS